MSQPFQWIADLFAREFDRAEVRAEYQHLAGEGWGEGAKPTMRQGSSRVLTWRFWFGRATRSDRVFGIG
mgnify:CR=1 FL=1